MDDAAPASDVVGSTQSPPVNTFQTLSTRRSIVLSYWLVIVLCLPYWWYSTTIERHWLPLDEIATWSAKQPCPVTIDVPISFDKSIASHREILANLRSSELSKERCLDFRIADARLPDTSRLTSTIGNAGNISFTGSRSANIQSSSIHHEHLSILTAIAPSPLSEPFSRQHVSLVQPAVKYSSRVKLVFSLLNEDITAGGITSWDASHAIQSYISPLLNSLSKLHRFDVETQIQYFAPLLVERHVTAEGAIIDEDQLKAFVNSAEWNLASSVSSDPVLHFILYVPAPAKSPLMVKNSMGGTRLLEAFSVPQWGGLVVSAAQAHLSSSDLAIPFDIFAKQLRALIGMPAIAGMASVYRSQWETSALMRERTLQNAKDTVDRLSAISRQVNEIQNMRIPLAVQTDVTAALQALSQMEGASLAQAMNLSATALDHSARASFNHEMLALLYFPEEHKWAVYTPLFGPLVVPLVLALAREAKEYRKIKRERALKAKAE